MRARRRPPRPSWNNLGGLLPLAACGSGCARAPATQGSARFKGPSKTTGSRRRPPCACLDMQPYGCLYSRSQMTAFPSEIPQAQTMDAVFRALADPGRRQLLDSLNARNGQTLRDLCAEMHMTRQSVSKHLSVLEEANLVSTLRRGREKLHYLNAAPINDISERW